MKTPTGPKTAWRESSYANVGEAARWYAKRHGYRLTAVLVRERVGRTWGSPRVLVATVHLVRPADGGEELVARQEWPAAAYPPIELGAAQTWAEREADRAVEAASPRGAR